MDAASKASFRAALKQAEAELKNHDARGEALRGTVAALREVLGLGAPKAAAPARKAPARKRRAVKKKRRYAKPGESHPEIPENMFQGLGPTKAFRKFVENFGDDFANSTIANALFAGNVQSKSRASVIQGISNVRRRDKQKAAAARKEAARAAAPAAD